HHRDPPDGGKAHPLVLSVEPAPNGHLGAGAALIAPRPTEALLAGFLTRPATANARLHGQSSEHRDVAEHLDWKCNPANACSSALSAGSVACCSYRRTDSCRSRQAWRRAASSCV